MGGISVATVDRAIAALVEKKLIRRNTYAVRRANVPVMEEKTHFADLPGPLT
jgi:hypothetical protein